ncbi:MAG: hypothetical protein WD046_01240 [Paracoccaceae bacterium]
MTEAKATRGLAPTEKVALVALGVLSVPSVAYLGYLLIFAGLVQALIPLVLPTLAGVLMWQYRGLLAFAPRAPGMATLRFFVLALGFVALSGAIKTLFLASSQGVGLAALFGVLGQSLLWSLFIFGGAALAAALVFGRIRFSRLEMLMVLVVFAMIVDGPLLRVLRMDENWMDAVILLPVNMWLAVIVFLPAVLAAEVQPRQTLPLLARYVLVICAIVLASFVFGFAAAQMVNILPGLFS